MLGTPNPSIDEKITPYKNNESKEIQKELNICMKKSNPSLRNELQEKLRAAGIDHGMSIRQCATCSR
jgi:hypothetical protein